MKSKTFYGREPEEFLDFIKNMMASEKVIDSKNLSRRIAKEFNLQESQAYQVLTGIKAYLDDMGIHSTILGSLSTRTHGPRTLIYFTDRANMQKYKEELFSMWVLA